MVREVVLKTLGELGFPAAEVTDETRLKADLELDSTELVQIELEIKRRLSVDVKFEFTDELSVGDVCRVVAERLPETTRTTA